MSIIKKISHLKSNFETIINLTKILQRTGKVYLIPFLFLLLVLSILLGGLQIIAPLAPFVYSLF